MSRGWSGRGGVIPVSNPFEWTWGKADWGGGGLDLRELRYLWLVTVLLANPALDWTVCPTDEHVSIGFG